MNRAGTAILNMLPKEEVKFMLQTRNNQHVGKEHEIQ